MYISKVPSAKTRALLSGGFGRLDAAKPDAHTQSGWAAVLNIFDKLKLLQCDFLVLKLPFMGKNYLN